MATGTIGEGNFEDNYEEGIVGEEETDSLDGSSSIQKTRKSVDFVVVTVVTNS